MRQGINILREVVEFLDLGKIEVIVGEEEVEVEIKVKVILQLKDHIQIPIIKLIIILSKFWESSHFESYFSLLFFELFFLRGINHLFSYLKI